MPPGLPLAGKLHDRDDRPDKGKACAKVAGDFPTEAEEKYERPYAAEKECHVGIKSHEKGGKHGGPEHGQHVLESHEDAVPQGEHLFWQDHALFFDLPDQEAAFFHQDSLDACGIAEAEVTVTIVPAAFPRVLQIF